MLDFVTGAPMPIKFGDRTLLVGALKLREEGLLVGYLRASTVRPSVLLRETIDLYPPEATTAVIREAERADRDWPPSPTSPEGQKVFLRTPEGQKFFLGVALRKHQPDLTEGDLDQILATLNEEDFLTLVHIAFGEDGLDPESARAAVRENLRKLQETLETLESLEATVALLGGSPDLPTGANSSATSPPSPPTGPGTGSPT